MNESLHVWQTISMSDFEFDIIPDIIYHFRIGKIDARITPQYDPSVVYKNSAISEKVIAV